MNKEQQALNTLREKGYTNHFQPITLEYQYPNEFKILQELVDQQAILEEYNVTPENIREVLLTGQMFRNQPTLDDCIKEWEERGYIIELGITHIWFSTVDGNIIATFDLCDKCVTTSLFIDYELSVLITKTLKALEVENE